MNDSEGVLMQNKKNGKEGNIPPTRPRHRRSQQAKHVCRRSVVRASL